MSSSVIEWAGLELVPSFTAIQRQMMQKVRKSLDSLVWDWEQNPCAFWMWILKVFLATYHFGMRSRDRFHCLEYQSKKG
jgi:hypothetical protein